MKTKEEILRGHYEIDGFVFRQNTPRPLAEKIISLINNRVRVVMDYGNTQTGESWGECHYTTGRIGYSRGHYDLKWPILVYNSRCRGGGSVLTDCILSIRTSAGKNLIYEHTR